MNDPNHGVALRLAKVGKAYAQHRVLSEVTFEVRQGEWVCLLGANGSGKSTLLEIIAGLKRRFTGEVQVLGQSPMNLAVRKRRGVQLERPSFPHYAKVKEIMWLFAGFHQKSLDWQALLTLFDLRCDAFIRQLSRGQQHVLAILVALVGRPDVLLLDEPGTGLDPEARLKLWQVLLQHCAKADGGAVLFATHDMAEAERRADRVLILHKGRIAAAGAPATLCREYVGTSMKVTMLTTGDAQHRGALRGLTERREVEAARQVGAELVLYTNDPRELVQHVPIDPYLQVRIEPVNLQDVFFSVAGNPTNVLRYAS